MIYSGLLFFGVHKHEFAEVREASISYQHHFIQQSKIQSFSQYTVTSHLPFKLTFNQTFVLNRD